MADQLSESERQVLFNALKKNRGMRKHTENNMKALGDPEIKHSLSPEERLINKIIRQQRDSRGQALLKAERIARAQKEWYEKVGERFSSAETHLPAIMDRVNRLETKKGKHKTSIVLSGAMGRGKTWQAYAYLNLLINKGIMRPGQIVFGTESETLGAIASAGFNRNEEMMDLKNPKHLVFFIDDVGSTTSYYKNYREETWFELINHVYNKNLTLILTTNLAFNNRELGQHIGPRSFDRLKALVGDDGVLSINGENKRPQVFSENEKQYKSLQ